MDIDGSEREESETSTNGADIPIALIGSHLSARIRAKGINSRDPAREYYLRFHVPQELSRVPSKRGVP